MNKLARKIHRVVSYLVFLQLTLWIVGGLTFAAIPFDSIVKGGSVTVPPQQPPFPANWAALIAPHQAQLGSLNAVNSYNSSQGLLLALEGDSQTRWVRMSDGRAAVAPDAESIATYARQLYSGEGELLATRYLDQSEYRYFGLVDELYGRVDVWQSSFDDVLGTRLYFVGDTGRYLTVRNNFWVLYDAMWRLHIMDYRAGEDFNNLLLLAFAILSLVFAVSGLILTYNAAKRSWLSWAS